MAKRWEIAPNRCNLIEIIYGCKTVEEMVEFWSELTDAEKKALKIFFTDHKEELRNGNLEKKEKLEQMKQGKLFKA